MEIQKLNRACRRDGIIALAILGVLLVGALLGVAKVHPGLETLRAQSGSQLAVTRSGDADVDADAIPEEVVKKFEPELGFLGQPYPEGIAAPTLEMILPDAIGATVEHVAVDEIAVLPPLEKSSNPFLALLGATEEPQVVTFRTGDVSRAAVGDWECAWIREYMVAASKNDEVRVARADQTLRQIPQHKQIAKLEAGLEKVHADVVVPLLKGDRSAASSFLSDKCTRGTH